MNPAGIELAESYHREVVGPLLVRRWPDLAYAAARVGTGSDVLGLDDAMSADHDWGLRLTVFVDDERVESVRRHLAETVPADHAGLPTRFVMTGSVDPSLATDVTSVGAFSADRLGVDARTELTVDDWLALTGQAVLEVTAGAVFHDTAGHLTALRHHLRWYPDDVWRFVIAADWRRIAEEFPFIGRTALRGDELGSRLIAARTARAVMHLGFVLERQWPPYAKWFGTLFAGLPHAGRAAVPLQAAVASGDWRERERSLADAVEVMADLQRQVGLPVPATVIEPFHDRPFLSVVAVDEILLPTVADPVLAARRPLVGSAEQWSDSVPGLVSAAWRRKPGG